jgi:hypothetical protein
MNNLTLRFTVSDEMIAWKTEGTALYQALPKDCHSSLLLCEPLTAPEENRPKQEILLWCLREPQHQTNKAG